MPRVSATAVVSAAPSPHISRRPTDVASSLFGAAGLPRRRRCERIFEIILSTVLRSAIRKLVWTGSSCCGATRSTRMTDRRRRARRR